MIRVKRKIFITLLAGALVASNALPVAAEPGRPDMSFSSESGTEMTGRPGRDMNDSSFGMPPGRPDNENGMMPGGGEPPEMQDGNTPPERPDGSNGTENEMGTPPEKPDGNGDMEQGVGMPPERPGGGSLSRNGTPPGKPDGDTGMSPGEGTPPERPDGDPVSRNGMPPEKPDGDMPPMEGRAPSENGFRPDMPDFGGISENGAPPERPDESGFPGGDAPKDFPHSTGISSNNAVVKQSVDVSPYFSDDTVKYKAFPKGSAKVNSQGLVKVRKAGEITVKGYNKDGEETGTYSFTAEKPVIKKRMKTSPGNSISVNEFISGTDAIPASFSSSNESVATVDEQGNVSVLKNGTAKITATFGTGSGAAKYSMKLKVNTDPS